MLLTSAQVSDKLALSDQGQRLLISAKPCTDSRKPAQTRSNLNVAHSEVAIAGPLIRVAGLPAVASSAA